MMLAGNNAMGDLPPLHQACNDANAELVATLVNQGFDVNAKGITGYTPLMLAARQHTGDKVVKILLDNNADPNSLDDYEMTPLHHAATTDSPSTINLLLKHGADPTLVEHTGATPLVLAVERGRLHAVKCLLTGDTVDQPDAKDAINRPDNEGRTPLHHAATIGSKEAIDLLVEHGANPMLVDHAGTTPLVLAIRRRKLDAIARLLDLKPELLSHTNHEGMTPLHEACITGVEQVVNYLLDRGANITCTDREGETPLMLAAQEGHVGVVSLLLHHQVPPPINQAAASGQTALYKACANGQAEVAKLLAMYGATTTTTTSPPLLAAAAESGDPATVKFLLYCQPRPSINQATEDKGRTALHFACVKGAKEVVDLLLRHGAGINRTDKSGRTPLAHAIENGHQSIARLLATHPQQTSINQATKDEERTALHFACVKGAKEVVDLLLRHGADINRRDKSGMTPLMLAAEARSPALVKCLFQPEIGPGVNSKDKKGKTALHHALNRGKRPRSLDDLQQVVDQLVTHGADPELRDNWNATPKYLAGVLRINLRSKKARIAVDT